MAHTVETTPELKILGEEAKPVHKIEQFWSCGCILTPTWFQATKRMVTRRVIFYDWNFDDQVSQQHFRNKLTEHDQNLNFTCMNRFPSQLEGRRRTESYLPEEQWQCSSPTNPHVKMQTAHWQCQETIWSQLIKTLLLKTSHLSKKNLCTLSLLSLLSSLIERLITLKIATKSFWNATNKCL